MKRPSELYVRWLGYVEGTSLLALLFIAMPLKWIADKPEGVRMIGTAHGILFLMYCYAILTLDRSEFWTWRRRVIAVITASVPFGPFWFEWHHARRNRSAT